jgi:hypothetical protein
MPEEDDDALGDMLGDRLKDSRDSDQTGPDEQDGTQSTESAGSTEISESTSNTESTQITKSTQSTQEDDEEVEQNTARSRSPFPLYITPELKADIQKRFEKFNAERTLNDEPQVEKHKHFMQGLLRAGLDHSDLEEYILEEFE